MEVPAYTLVIPCLTILGRKPTVIGTFTLTAVCSFIVAYTPAGTEVVHFRLIYFPKFAKTGVKPERIIAEYELIRVAVSMSGKLFITTCFAVLYLLGAELFPTSTRTTGNKIVRLECAMITLIEKVGIHFYRISFCRNIWTVGIYPGSIYC